MAVVAKHLDQKTVVLDCHLHNYSFEQLDVVLHRFRTLLVNVEPAEEVLVHTGLRKNVDQTFGLVSVS